MKIYNLKDIEKEFNKGKDYYKIIKELEYLGLVSIIAHPHKTYDIPKTDVIKEEILRQYQELLLEQENILKGYGVDITENFWETKIYQREDYE